ncbi:TonB-dependent receptor [Chitinophagaceae bacterium 26-R-25]|nr:TonB-dependent receptor [Chitinophagaceae bacterium 26-R-25]
MKFRTKKPKLLIIMRLTALFLFCFCLQVSARVNSQEVSYKVKNGTLENVLNEFKKQTGYLFIYNDKDMQKSVPVTVELKKIRIADALREVFSKQPLDYIIKGRTVVVEAQLDAGKAIAFPINATADVALPVDTIRGTVTDSLGNPLARATVAVAGTQKAVQTDATGEFSISAKGSDVLVFSSIGYEEKRMNANSVPSRVKLSTRIEKLEEVQVEVGYGRVRKQDITGAVSTVKMQDLQNIPVTRVDQMLAGRIAGAEFMSVDGAPGSGTTVRIRGTRSISASNEPLYVVDGVIDGINNLNDLNPSDIAGISVLKDASSTAIYGSRGANGVIIITTKMGKDLGGKTNFNLKTSLGFAEQPSYLPLMGATEYAQMLNDNFYLTSAANATQPLENYPFPDPLSLGKGSDWQRAITRRAPFANVSFTASGGSKTTRYFFSGSYDNDQGVILNSSMRRFLFRLNLDQTLSKYAKAGVRLSYSNTKQEQPMRYLGAYNNWSVSPTMVAPIVPIYNEDGSLNSWNSQNYSGGVSDLPLFDATLRKNTTNTGTNNAMIYLDIQPINDLVLHSSLSYSNSGINQDVLIPATMPSRGTAGDAIAKNVNKNDNLLNENTISYKHAFHDTHHLNAMYGFTVQQQNFNAISITGSGYYDDNTALWDIGSIPNKANLGVSGSKQIQTRMSHLARVNYDYNQKYYLTATVRKDGASNFAADNKWAYFPSAAIRWNMLKEKFMKNVNLDEFAIRLSAGTSGNDAIARYQSLDRLSSTTTGYLFGGTQPVAFYPSNIANDGLKWEKTTSYNLGVDLSLFNKRLDVTLEVYKSYTSDLLLSVQLPTQTGFSSRLMNFGKTSNKGIELTVNYDVIRSRNFSWSTSLTAAHDKQMVDDIGLVGRVVTNTLSYGASYMINGYLKGYPVNAAFGFRYAGVWHNQAEIDQDKKDKKYVSSVYAPGRQRYIDQNHDGVLNADDDIYLGNADPAVYGGWQNTLRYKKLFLSVYFNYSLGGVIYFPAGNFLGNASNLTTGFEYMVNRWQPVRNPDGDLPRPTSQDNIPSDRFLYDASFLRLKAASIGYTFDLTKITGSKLKSLALSLNGSNLFLLKNYIGYDPEVNTSGTSSTLRRIDNGSYPPNRTITFTAEIKF